MLLSRHHPDTTGPSPCMDALPPTSACTPPCARAGSRQTCPPAATDFERDRPGEDLSVRTNPAQSLRCRIFARFRRFFRPSFRRPLPDFLVPIACAVPRHVMKILELVRGPAYHPTNPAPQQQQASPHCFRRVAQSRSLRANANPSWPLARRQRRQRTAADSPIVNNTFARSGAGCHACIAKQGKHAGG